MVTNYAERLRIPVECPIDGVNTLYTKEGTCVANNYIRVVIGKRGPYVEFDHIFDASCYMPVGAEWRADDNRAYYIEYRAYSNTKIYYQKKPVDYADYQVGMYYISPFDLYLDKEGKVPVIEPLRKKNEQP